MKNLVLFLSLLSSGLAVAEEKVIFHCDFDAVMPPSTHAGTLVTAFEGSQSLRIERDEPGSSSRQFPIDAALFDARIATLEAVVKAEDVSAPPQPWNGIKVMLILESASGAKTYPQIPIPAGSFDWKAVRTRIRLPADNSLPKNRGGSTVSSSRAGNQGFCRKESRKPISAMSRMIITT